MERRGAAAAAAAAAAEQAAAAAAAEVARSEFASKAETHRAEVGNLNERIADERTEVGALLWRVTLGFRVYGFHMCRPYAWHPMYDTLPQRAYRVSVSRHPSA